MLPLYASIDAYKGSIIILMLFLFTQSQAHPISGTAVMG
jgi:hypothetical protein